MSRTDLLVISASSAWPRQSSTPARATISMAVTMRSSGTPRARHSDRHTKIWKSSASPATMALSMPNLR